MAIQRIQFRRGLAADWTSVNPVLASGEPGFETDTGLVKIGDGTSAWTALEYLSSPGTGGGTGGTTGPIHIADITDATDIGRSVMAGASNTAVRTLLGINWTNLSGKPVVIAAGADATEARTAIGAMSSQDVSDLIDALRTEVANGYVRSADLLLAKPYFPLTSDFTVAQNTVNMAATGVKRTSLKASTTYRFAVRLDYDAQQTVDLRLNLLGPTGATIRATVQGYIPGATAATNAWFGADLTESGASTATVGGLSTAATATVAGGLVAPALITGWITLGTTAGDLEVRATQATAGDVKTLIKSTSTFDLAECAA